MLLVIFATGVVALLVILVMVAIWGDTIWVMLASVPPIVVIAVVQYRLIAAAFGKR